MGDILPYTCIFEGCPETNTFYMSKETWLSHMEKEHWGIEQWECRACSQKNIYVTFRESSHFTAHIEQQHSKGIKPQQIPMLRLAWRRKVPLKVSACPLCCFESDDQNALLDHTAEHIHSFSLKSLPWAPREGFEGNDDKGEGDEEEEFGSFFNQHSYFDVDSCRSEVLSTSSGGSALATKPGSIAGSDSRAPANSIYEEQKQQLTEDLLEQVPHEILGQSGTGDWLQILDNDPEEPNPLPMPYDPDSPPISATDEKVLPGEFEGGFSIRVGHLPTFLKPPC
jgi:hypothetical protein